MDKIALKSMIYITAKQVTNSQYCKFTAIMHAGLQMNP